MSIVYIGLGSNLGDKEENLKNAKIQIEKNSDISILKESSIVETIPVDYLNQPNFLNQIIITKTGSDPITLLEFLQSIERGLGRIPTINKGSRTIDLDILLYNNQIINTDKLEIPHPRIKKRTFILMHLYELNRDLKDPISGEFYKSFFKSDVNS